MTFDERIGKAAAESVECYMETITSDYDPADTFTPSAGFEKKISRLTRRANRPRAYRVWQRAASLLLPVILVGTVWLASDSDARAGFKSWFRTEQENSASYDFVGERDPEPLPEYEFATLPEGFVETNFLGGETTHIRIYENNGEELFLSYAKMAEGIATGVFSEGHRYEAVQVGSCPGDFYEVEKSDDTNELLWFDEEKHIFFGISAFMTKEEMISLAECVEKK